MGEAGILARVVDVGVRVQDVADVGAVQAVLRQCRVQALSLADVARHVQALHDLGIAGAGVDQDRPLRVAEDQDAPGGHARAHPHVAREHEKARLELDLDQRQELDLVGWHLDTSSSVARSVSASAARLKRAAGDSGRR